MGKRESVTDKPVVFHDTLPITAVILAGGRSLRMGVDKTQLPLGGLPMVARATASMEAIASETIIVTNRPDELPLEYIDSDVIILKDEVAYQGPLGGLATALPVASQDWILAVAADMPWVNPDVIKTLYSYIDNHDVVIAVGENGPEPLLALYRKETVLPAAREVIETGRRRIVAMFDKLRVAEVDTESLREVDPKLASFFNVNTQTDLAEAHEYAEKLGISSPEEDEELFDKASSLPFLEQFRTIRVMMANETGRPMPTETPITVYLNDVEVATVQATSHDLEDMAVGFLVSEGLLRDRSKFKGVDVDQKRGLVYVTSDEDVPDDLVYKTRYVTSGCGKGITFSSVGHARGLEPVTQIIKVHSSDLYRWTVEMSQRSAEYKERGGVHSCGLVVGGELKAVREDVGRHNAADKLIGYAWRNNIDMTKSVLISTGRISYEMMVKAAKCRIPFVASRSAATDLAAEIANHLGITLGGYIRGGKVVIYTHPERLVTEEELAEEEG